MSIVLITGVNGFIGSHIAEYFSHANHRVRGIIRKSSELKFIKDLDIELFYGDLTDQNSLIAPTDGADIVVHAAGLASDWGSYESFFAVNVTGTQNIAEVAHRSQVKRFVHLSTTALHGFPGFRNIDESYPAAETIFPYCETKKIAEQWLFRFAKSTEMEITAIRPGNVFGPRDHTFIEKFLDAMVANKIGYISGGKSLTAPTYIENLVDGIVRASFEDSAVGEAFFITDGLEITWKDFTERFADEIGVERPKISIPFWAGYGLAFLMETAYSGLRCSNPPLLTRYRISNGGRDYHFSIEKAKAILKYEPSVGFDEAVRRTVRWYRQRS